LKYVIGNRTIRLAIPDIVNQRLPLLPELEAINLGMNERLMDSWPTAYNITSPTTKAVRLL
jgi:hypothetical protein